MRKFMKVLAIILFVLSGITSAIAVIAVFADSTSNLGLNSSILAGAVTSLLLSGAVWLLADIAESLQAGRETIAS